MFKSLKTKLLFSHLGAVLFVSLVLGSISNSSLSRYLLTLETDNLKHSSRHSAKIIQDTLDDLASDLRHISDDRTVMDYLDNYRDLALQEHFTRFQKTFPQIAVINKRGEEEFKIINGVSGEQHKRSHSPELINRLIANPAEVIIFASGTDPDLKIPTIRMALAKSHYFGNKFAGIISASVPYSLLGKKIQSENLDPDSYLIISDSKKNAIAIFPSETPRGNIKIEYRKPPDAFPLSIDATINDADVKRRLIYDTDSLVASTRIPGIDLNIQAVIPYEPIHAKLSKIRNTILITLAFILFLTGIFSYFIAHRMTRPIMSLIHYSREIASGQKGNTLDIDTTSEDEISQLVGSFQKMMDAIAQSTVSRNYLDNIIATMSENVLVVNSDEELTTINRSAIHLFSAAIHDERIISLADIFPEENLQYIRTMIKSGVSQGEMVFQDSSGEKRHLLISATPIPSGTQDNREVVLVSTDISYLKKIEHELTESKENLKKLSITDELTGLYNRRGFITLAQQQLHIANRNKKELHLLYADLDNMKGINDDFGHQTGDTALQDGAMVLKRFCRESDIISRIGGDKFAVLLTGSDDETAIVKRLEQEIQAFNDTSGRPYILSISIGVTSCQPDNEPCEILQFMSRADTLMYEAKKARQASSPSA